MNIFRVEEDIEEIRFMLRETAKNHYTFYQMKAHIIKRLNKIKKEVNTTNEFQWDFDFIKKTIK